MQSSHKLGLKKFRINYTLLLLGGRHPLCGSGVTSIISETSIPSQVSSQRSEILAECLSIEHLVFCGLSNSKLLLLHEIDELINPVNLKSTYMNKQPQHKEGIQDG